MGNTTADVVICGAGIAGIAAAYFLTVQHGIADVALIDERPPLSLTSDKSTECYRNWWPGPGNAMVGLMNRSIDLLERLADESDNVFGMNRRGYVYATANRTNVDLFQRAAVESAELGSGELRCHSAQTGGSTYQPAAPSGFKDQPTGADLILDRALIRQHFPYLADETVAVLHARRCGWLSAQQLGMYLWDQARQHGARIVRGRVEAVTLDRNRVAGVVIREDAATTTIATRAFVNAAGPFVGEVGQMLGVDLPVLHEPHLKIAFEDYLGIVPRDAPMMISADPTPLVWSDAERAELADDPDIRHLLDVFPAGAHTRPEGGPDSTIVLLLWSYHAQPTAPRFPLPVDPDYPEIALRGLATMLPDLRRYLDHPPKPIIDGGYYTKTQENRPLIGPLPVDGAFVIGALSGYGIMAACGAGELLAAQIVGGDLPSYAPAFALARYDDPAYQRLLATWGDSGQL